LMGYNLAMSLKPFMKFVILTSTKKKNQNGGTSTKTTTKYDNKTRAHELENQSREESQTILDKDIFNYHPRNIKKYRSFKEKNQLLFHSLCMTPIFRNTF